jgi:hypothetical protein
VVIPHVLIILLEIIVFANVCKKSFLFYLSKYILYKGPICRHPLNEGDKHNVSYNLEEASRLHHTTTMHHDEISARRLQTKFIPEVQNERSTTRPTAILALISAATSELEQIVHIGQQCGHYCRTPQYCSCSG